ncbi:transcriptional regulatory protein OmpR [mine drainage metagenome]|uniref:Transcriptional regulatory protein OmpR n=1 Tax=mine drainage metagenome TaxID=410659 RepID=A0A1J5PBX9_9ZZZZ
MPAARQLLHFGPWTLDPMARTLSRDGRPVKLSSGECAMLLALARQPGRPLGRERLIALAYGPGHDSNDRSVDVQILRLRRLLEDDAVDPRFIQTVRGVGYVFAPDGGLR